MIDELYSQESFAVPGKKLNEVVYWSIERRKPEKGMIDGVEVNLTGLIQETPVSKLPAMNLGEFIQTRFGPGEYTVYGCGANGENITNKTVVIPEIIDAKDMEILELKAKLLLTEQKVKDLEKEMLISHYRSSKIKDISDIFSLLEQLKEFREIQ